MTQLITAAELGRFAPNSPPELRAELARTLSTEMVRRGIDKPLIIQHFLAHLAHESGEWTIKRENMRYKPTRIMEIFGVGKHSAKITWVEAQKLANNARALANRVYGLGNPKKAKELGNTGPDDGWLFRGGGDIQTTGKAAYATTGKMIGADLVGKPDLIGELPFRVKAACAEWTKLRYAGKTASQWALADDIEKSCRAVNGGKNGLADRVRKLARAKQVWPAELLAARLKGDIVAISPNPAPEPEDVPVPKPKPTGEFSRELVFEIQTKLKALGYRPGHVDGDYGPETRNAIMAFEADNSLPVTGKPTMELLDKILHADLKPISEKRQDVTVEDLKDSRIVKGADKVSLKTKIMRWLGLGGLAVPGGIGAADDLVDLDKFTSVSGQVKTLLASIGPYWWVFAIAGGVGLYLWFRSVENDAAEVIAARLEDERTGKTL
jgi:predicted chitinase